MNIPHVTNKMPTAINGCHSPGKIKHFRRRHNKEMAIRIPYNIFSYDCHSFLVRSKLKGISDVYLEPSRTSMVELFSENS